MPQGVQVRVLSPARQVSVEHWNFGRDKSTASPFWTGAPDDATRCSSACHYANEGLELLYLLQALIHCHAGDHQD